MFDEQDQETGPVLMLVIAIAIVISLFSIAIALSLTGVFSGAAPEAPAATETATTGTIATPVEAPVAPGAVKIYFALGSSVLPGDAPATLEPVIASATAEPARHVEISGYHDASGDRAKNAELAKARAFAVRDALVQAGIATERIELHKPVEVLGGADPQEARRVDVGVR